MPLPSSPEAVVVLAAAAGTLLGALRAAAAARLGLRAHRRAAAPLGRHAAGGRTPLRIA